MENKGLTNRTLHHLYIEERLLKNKDKDEPTYLAIHDLRTYFEDWIARSLLLEDLTDIKKTIKYLPVL